MTSPQDEASRGASLEFAGIAVRSTMPATGVGDSVSAVPNLTEGTCNKRKPLDRTAKQIAPYLQHIELLRIIFVLARLQMGFCFDFALLEFPDIDGLRKSYLNLINRSLCGSTYPLSSSAEFSFMKNPPLHTRGGLFAHRSNFASLQKYYVPWASTAQAANE